MSLWDLIRDFFVLHVFGGTTSIGDTYSYMIGANDYDNYLNTGNFYVKVGDFTGAGEEWLEYITLGDWLSTTATAISITIIVVICCLFIYKIVRLIGGLIR